MNKYPWALASELEEQYHDTEWGVPVHDDRLLFEFLILEGAQAGLSWATVLKNRHLSFTSLRFCKMVNEALACKRLLLLIFL